MPIRITVTQSPTHGKSGDEKNTENATAATDSSNSDSEVRVPSPTSVTKPAEVDTSADEDGIEVFDHDDDDTALDGKFEEEKKEDHHQATTTQTATAATAAAAAANYCAVATESTTTEAATTTTSSNPPAQTVETVSEDAEVEEGKKDATQAEEVETKTSQELGTHSKVRSRSRSRACNNYQYLSDKLGSK